MSPASAATTVIHADHIRFVYPESQEVSGTAFPPNEDRGAVKEQLHSIMVLYRGDRTSLGKYLRALHLDPGKIVTIKVQGGNAAVYTYH